MWVITPQEVAQLVRDRRKQLGWSMEALAQQTGVSRQWIGMLERGKPTVELAAVMKVLAALGLRIDIRDGAAGTTFAAPLPALDAAGAARARPLRRLPTRLSRRPSARGPDDPAGSAGGHSAPRRLGEP